MKKTLLVALFFVANALKLANAFQLPLDRDGQKALDVTDVGVYVFMSTSEVSWLLNGSTQVLAGGSIQGGGSPQVNGSSVAIYAVLTSTFSGDWSSPAFVELRSTNTANSTSELLVPPIPIGISTGTTGPAVVAKNNWVIFNPPIVSADQVSVRISSALGALTTWRFNAAIFYRYLSTSQPEDVWIPNDDREGEKAIGGASLYGVRASTGGLNNVVNDGVGAEMYDFKIGPVFVQTSTMPENQGPEMLYGWSASSGNATTWFGVDDSTGIGDYVVQPGVVTSSFTFLPKIYPHTFGEGYNNYPWSNTVSGLSLPAWAGYNFPWPVVARKGLRFTASTQTERFRLHSRNRRALR